MAKTFFYIDDWTDEVLPCIPTLEAWAAWLADDISDEWGREGSIADGAEFNVSRLTDLGTIAVKKDADGKWWPGMDVPEGTSLFFAREHLADGGWDADFSGSTIDDALTDYDADETEAYLACVREEAHIRVRFEVAGPRLVVIGEVH